MAPWSQCSYATGQVTDTCGGCYRFVADTPSLNVQTNNFNHSCYLFGVLFALMLIDCALAAGSIKILCLSRRRFHPITTPTRQKLTLQNDDETKLM